MVLDSTPPDLRRTPEDLQLRFGSHQLDTAKETIDFILDGRMLVRITMLTNSASEARQLLGHPSSEMVIPSGNSSGAKWGTHLSVGRTFRASHAPAMGELNLATFYWVRWLKTTYSAGERACSSRILALAVCKSRTTSTHLKFTTSIFFRM